MVKTGIKIFARLRPTKKTTGVYEVGQCQDGQEALSVTVPRSEPSCAVNNRRETYSFKFSRVFDVKASQEEVFDAVSREVIDNCLEGYNGTIFAYGQTGSGKTFTITGGVERFSDRGLIPRSLSYLFQQYQKAPGTIFTTHISYLEIYNESGYDLLDPRHETSRLEDLPKVTLMEDRESVIHLRNLSLQPANNEEEALNWLFLGDTNRVMAETPMNMASTRSHCIFTVHISAREPSSELIRRAKLHLVDLAGSERVGRTGVEGTLLTEAKHINLSLHFLEQVIVALSDKSRSHIPYRNSMMTSVLRDSLGGNCMTSMIATCSVEKRNIDETVSTCRFSQRVAMIKNEVTINEELDPKLMVQQLKQQVAELTEQLSLAAGGEEREGELDPTERQRCEQLVEEFLEDPSPDGRLLVGGDMRKIQLCFSLLKAKVLSSSSPQTTNHPTTAMTSDPKLEEIIQQRDQEINMLQKMLDEERRKVAQLQAAVKTTKERGGGGGEEVEEKREEEREVGKRTEEEKQDEMAESRRAWKSELSRARQEAFDQFRRTSPLMLQVTQHKTELRTRYSEAKTLGEQVQRSRNTINELKGRLERHRISQGLAGLTRGVVSEEDSGEKEAELKIGIEEEKAKFKSLYQRLRGMKTEIEHIQHLLHMAKVKVQQEFEVWWKGQVPKEGGVSRCAWRTPPTSTQSPQSLSHNPITSSSRHREKIGHQKIQEHHSSHSEQTTDQSLAAVPRRAVPLAGRAPSLPQPLFPSSHLPTPTSHTSPSSHQPTSPTSKSHPPTDPHVVPLTGDPRADADIIAFCRARQHLLNNRGPR